MNTKISILIIFLSLNLTSFGQICGTEALESIPSSQRTVTMPKYLSTSNSICFNVYYHILRNDSGVNGYNPDDLNLITNTLNNAFNQHNIYVNQLGYDFIDNSRLAVIDDFGSSTVEFDELVQINNNPNAINIYLVINAFQWIGKADGILSQALVIENQHA
ncbi:MAG: hypothetical protein L3J25_05845, partial [Flavobacteriaceae bacterium]|nr:hypothetical protein [Flavobacteriaceae bacterium]